MPGDRSPGKEPSRPSCVHQPGRAMPMAEEQGREQLQEELWEESRHRWEALMSTQTPPLIPYFPGPGADGSAWPSCCAHSPPRRGKLCEPRENVFSPTN